MVRSAKALLLVVSLGGACLAQQTPPASSTAPDDNKAGAYYHFAMGRLYGQMAQAEGSKADLAKAIDHYQQALKLDPTAGIIFDELTDIYIQTGRLQDAVTQAEDVLKRNPDNLDAHRILGRIYTRMIGNGQENRGGINEEYLRKAIEQYQKVVQKEPKDAESWVVLGRLYRVSNNSPEAEKAFNTALAAEPENEDALTGLASLYTDLGDSKRAAEKLKEISSKNPSAGTLAALAKAYEGLNDYKNAAEALKRAIALAPDNEQLLPALADDLLYSDQTDEAVKIYEKLATANPREPQFQVRLAEIYLMKHNLAGARTALEKAKAAEPDSVQVRYEEVLLLDAEGKTDQAIDGLKRILDDTASPNKPYSDNQIKYRETFLVKLAGLYREKNQPQQAADALRQIIAFEPDSGPKVTTQVIEVYRSAKDLAGAQREAEAAVKKYPKDLGLQFELAGVYQDAKKFTEMDKALADAEKLSTSDKEKEMFHFQRGAMMERQKKYDVAEAEFRKVIDLNPSNSTALNYLGYMLADRDVRLDEASKLIKKALELEPDNGAFMDSLGWLYYRQGKLDDAVGLLVKALETQNDPTIHDHLGDVYSKQGKKREAIAQWEASLKEYKANPTPDVDSKEMDKVSKKLEEAQAQLARGSNK